MSERSERSERQVWIRQCDDQSDPGWRLRISREPYDIPLFTEERVLPEQLHNPDAHAVFEKTAVWLTTDDVRWLHRALGELLGELEDET